jgi:hypothetical protein
VFWPDSLLEDSFPPHTDRLHKCHFTV